MNILKKPFLNKLLLACLMLQSVLPAFLAADTAEETIEHRLSTQLNSPIRSDYDAIKKIWRSSYLPAPHLPEDVITQAKESLGFDEEELYYMTSGDKEKLNLSKKTPLLADLQTLNDLGEPSILENAKKTITRAGKISIYSLLNQEFQPLKTIKARQNFIRTLKNNPDLLLSIQELLKVINDQEEKFLNGLSYARNYDLEWKIVKKITALSYFLSKFFRAIADAAPQQQRAPLLMIEFFFTMIYLSALALQFFSPTSIRYPDLLANIIEKGGAIAAAGLLVLSGKHLIQNIRSDNQLAIKCILGVIQTAGLIFAGSTLIDFIKDNLEIFHSLKPVITSQKAALQIHELLLSNPETEVLYIDLFAENTQQWERICSKIENSGVTENSSYNIITTPQGTIKNLLREIKEGVSEFGTLFRFYGELDAYQAIAQMLIDSEQAQNKFGEPVSCCLAEFVENTDVATLDAENFWNPVISAEYARPSTVQLGYTADGPRDMLITGPNGGGKSATLKALLNNIVWAQTFGVAFASKFASTYFDLIVNRVSGDNTAKDSSRFVTEARSVAKFFKDILALNPNQFALIITDEMFSSTETKPAKMLSTEVCERIAQMKNTIYMLATHFKKLSCLEKTTNGIFKNYKVHVRKNPETGKLVYDYKLHPGVGTTNVAFDIFKEQLEKEGACDETILNLITAAQQRYHEETEENQDALPQPILVQ